MFSSAALLAKRATFGLAAAGTAATAAAFTPTAESQEGLFGTISKIKETVINIEKRLEVSHKKLKTLDDYPRYFRHSISGSVLTPEFYLQYANVEGPRGFSFDEAIQCGIDTRSQTGCALPDEESYDLWQDFYDAVIEKCHGHPPGAIHETDLDYTKIDKSPLPDDLDKYVKSTRIRAARNISGFGLPPAATRGERRAVAAIAQEGLMQLEGELKGKYFDLASMSKTDEKQLIDDHFLFQKPDPNAMIFGCGGCRDWPDARGIYHNADKTFLVWVNEEDQMRVISMQMGGDVVDVFRRWVDGVNGVEKVVKNRGLKFMANPHCGMLSACVSNLGTGLRASMMVRLPKTYEQVGMHSMEELAVSMEMQVRGGKGEHTPPGPGGVVDISNWKRLGRSEVQLVQTMVNGVAVFIDLEKRCERGENIKPLIADLIKKHSS
jgi:creatine kinase